MRWFYAPLDTIKKKKENIDEMISCTTRYHIEKTENKLNTLMR